MEQQRAKDIVFDSNNRIRVLDEEKFSSAENVKENCTEFVDRTSFLFLLPYLTFDLEVTSFVDSIGGFVESVNEKSKVIAIEKEKVCCVLLVTIISS